MAKELPNLRVLTSILIEGQHVEAGTVFPKTAMAKTDWQNLVHGFGDNPRLAETDDAVGLPGDDDAEDEPKPAKAGKAAMPGAGA